MRLIVLAASIFSYLGPLSFLVAQSADTPIYRQGGTDRKEEDKRIIEQLLRLREEGNLISKQEIDRQTLATQPQFVELQPVRDQEMRTRWMHCAICV